MTSQKHVIFVGLHNVFAGWPSGNNRLNFVRIREVPIIPINRFMILLLKIDLFRGMPFPESVIIFVKHAGDITREISESTGAL